jgi:hypothetical protein
MNVTATSDAAELRHRESERRAYIKKRVLPNIDGRVRLTTSQNGKTTELSKPTMNNDSGGVTPPDARHLAARARARKRLTGLYSTNQDSGVPPPVEGRKHCQIQTEKWLEEIQVSFSALKTLNNVRPQISVFQPFWDHRTLLKIDFNPLPVSE